MADTKEALWGLYQVLAQCDQDGEGVWLGQSGTLIINCNDLFYWASADGEPFTTDDLPLLRQTLADLKAADAHFGDCYLMELWCCRKRAMRPQYPFFRKYDREKCAYTEDSLSPAVRALFDACGPEGSDRERG